MSVGTIIVFIAGILVAVIAAIVFLQIANSLRGQAMLTQRQAEESLSNRFVIDRVEGISYRDSDGVYKVFYLIMRVKVGIGAESLSLDKAVITYSDPQVTIPAAVYKPLYEVIADNNASIQRDFNKSYEDFGNLYDACTAELYDVMSVLGAFSYQKVIPYIAPAKKDINLQLPPNAFSDPSHFTVVWEDCDEKHDVHTLYDGQTAYVIYPLPHGVRARDYVTIDLHLTEGWPAPMKLRIPAGLDRGYVLIYPSA